MSSRGVAESGGKSRCSRRLTVCLVASALIALSAVGSASAAPAVDEYNSRLPDASGPKTLGPSSPQSNPEELPVKVREQLGQSPDRETLGRIATSDELRAPPPVRGLTDDVSTDGRGLLGAALSGISDLLGILIVLGLAGIATAAYLMRRSGVSIGGGPA
jgi:hypothetical protein